MLDPLDAARHLKEVLAQLPRRPRPAPIFAAAFSQLEALPFTKRAAELEHFRHRLAQLLPAALELVRGSGGWDQPLLDLPTDVHLYEDSVRDAVTELERAIQKAASAASGLRRGKSLPPCTFEVDGDMAVLRSGGRVQRVRGPRRVWLLKRVIESPRAVTWEELIREDMRGAAEELLRRQARRGTRDQAVKMATSRRTLQNLGTRVRKDLGELGCYWQQNGVEVEWTYPRTSEEGHAAHVPAPGCQESEAPE